MLNVLGIIAVIAIGLFLGYKSSQKDIRFQRCLDCNRPIYELQNAGDGPFKRYCDCEWKVYPPEREAKE